MSGWYASFNLNERVKVRLTPEGMEKKRRCRREINLLILANGGTVLLDVEPKLDDEGYFHTQLWALMRDFGDLMDPGEATPFEEGRILIEIQRGD